MPTSFVSKRPATPLDGLQNAYSIGILKYEEAGCPHRFTRIAKEALVNANSTGRMSRVVAAAAATGPFFLRKLFLSRRRKRSEWHIASTKGRKSFRRYNSAPRSRRGKNRSAEASERVQREPELSGRRGPKLIASSASFGVVSAACVRPSFRERCFGCGSTLAGY